jgi:hypothetical protein
MIECEIISPFYGRDNLLHSELGQTYFATEEEAKKLVLACCLKIKNQETSIVEELATKRGRKKREG